MEMLTFTACSIGRVVEAIGSRLFRMYLIREPYA